MEQPKCPVCHRFLKTPKQFHSCLCEITIKDTKGHTLVQGKSTSLGHALTMAGKDAGISGARSKDKLARVVKGTIIVEFNPNNQ